jgi:hypothetical protein
MPHPCNRAAILASLRNPIANTFQGLCVIGDRAQSCCGKFSLGIDDYKHLHSILSPTVLEWKK